MITSASQGGVLGWLFMLALERNPSRKTKTVILKLHPLVTISNNRKTHRWGGDTEAVGWQHWTNFSICSPKCNDVFFWIFQQGWVLCHMFCAAHNFYIPSSKHEPGKVKPVSLPIIWIFTKHSDVIMYYNNYIHCHIQHILLMSVRKKYW